MSNARKSIEVIVQAAKKYGYDCLIAYTKDNKLITGGCFMNDTDCTIDLHRTLQDLERLKYEPLEEGNER